MITRFYVAPVVAPANTHDLSASRVRGAFFGVVVGDRNYWSAKTKAELTQGGVELLMPYQHIGSDSVPRRSALLSRMRYRIDMVFSACGALPHQAGASA